MKPTGATLRLHRRRRRRRFEMRIAYRHAAPPALVESNTVASRKSAEKTTVATTEGCALCRDRHGGATFLRTPRAEGPPGRLGYSLYVPRISGSALLFEYGVVRGVSKSSRSEEYLSTLFGFGRWRRRDGNAERVWSASAVTRGPFGSLWARVFLICQFSASARWNSNGAQF